MKPSRLQAVVDLFSMLADPTRMLIAVLLARGSKPVKALCYELNQRQSVISHHLNLLRTTGMVGRERKGREVHYSLNRKALEPARAFLANLK